MKKIILFLLSIMLLFPSTISIFGQIDQDLIIELNCENTNGIIKNYANINCGPIPNEEYIGAVDLTNQYKEIGIDFIRTHDFSGPTDISTIFPDFSKDPKIESNYNFSSTDKFIKGIIDMEAKVFYRLGESASANNSLRKPPTNFSKWAEICKHIVMHYNDGWADGYHYNITHWEIWNEPDLNGFWNGTPHQYYQLYHIATDVLKTYNSSIKIGGPCTSSIFNENFTINFLNYLKENNLPLDFYSWHMYANTPNDLFVGSKYIRNLLDSYGYTKTENINTEWNYNIIAPQRDKDNAKNAAFTACSITSFNDAGIDYSFRYRGTQDTSWLSRFIGFDLALFSYMGEYKTPALSYLNLNQIIKDTPIRLKTKDMDYSSGITYLAGISDDKTNISILISNFEAGNQPYNIIIDNLPWDTDYSMIQYIIDDQSHLQINKQITSNDKNLNYNDIIESSTVQHIRLTNSSIIPEEGPPDLDIPLLFKLRFLDPIRSLIGIILITIIFG